MTCAHTTVRTTPRTLGPLELAVLGYLWRNGARTAKEITRAITWEHGDVTENTISVTLLRLRKKGLVEPADMDAIPGQPNRYRTIVTRAELASEVALPIWTA